MDEYAIIVSGGKQYKAKTGDILTVEKLCGNTGDAVDIKVIFKSNGETISTEPTNGKAEIIAHGKGKKITVYKYKAKKNVRRKHGHRQEFSKIKILSV